MNQLYREEEEEDHFLAAVPYVPPPAAVPHINPDDPLLLIPAADPDEMPSPDYDAPPSPQQVGEKPRSNFDFLSYRDDLDNCMGNIHTGEITTDEDMPANFNLSWEHIPRITNLVTLVDVDNAMEGVVQNVMILFKDHHVWNDTVNLQMLEASINDIAFITGYLAGYYIQQRKVYLQAQGQDENWYYKIRVTTQAYFMKPTVALEGEDTYKIFDNERIINQFDP